MKPQAITIDLKSWSRAVSGASGDREEKAVRQIQNLISKYDPNVRVDGKYTPDLKAAIIKFQREHFSRSGERLEASGDVCEQTIDALSNSSRWLRHAVANILMLLASATCILIWNARAWDSQHADYKLAVTSIILGSLALIFGSQQFTLALAPAHLKSLRRFLVRTQRSWQLSAALAILLSTSIALAISGWRPIPNEPRKKSRDIYIGVMLNGDAPYATSIYAGLLSGAERALADTNFMPHFFLGVGSAKTGDDTANKNAFERLMATSPQKLDYLVTIGSEVSRFANDNYGPKHGNQKSGLSHNIIFIGVTDPVGLGLVKHFGPDSTRGSLCGTSYGIRAVDRLDFLRLAFPSKRLGFIYNESIVQDRQMADVMAGLPLPMKVVKIAVTEPSLTQEHLAKADVFFGWYYFHSNFSSFYRSAPQTPFMGGYEFMRQFTPISMHNDDSQLGEDVASEILCRNLIEGTPLCDMDIMQPKKAVVCVNDRKLRELALRVSETAKARADQVIEER